MSSRIWLRLAEIIVPMLLAITIVLSWQADRRARARLAIQLADAQKIISQATANQRDRDTLLNQTLAQLAAQKQSVVTPAQILKALPQALSLPSQLTFQAANPGANPENVAVRLSASSNAAHAANSASEGSANPPNNPIPKGPSPDAVLPAADLKPLYDFALDCKVCQARLAAAQSDLSDEKTKSAALTKERDQAIAAAKGGSALRRIARAAKWFALGAVAGAAAAKAAH